MVFSQLWEGRRRSSSLQEKQQKKISGNFLLTFTAFFLCFFSFSYEIIEALKVLSNGTGGGV
jgi:hypothetical protein